jgi:type IV secretion system protein VirB5
MKKNLIAAVIAAALLCPQVVSASGIPSVDIVAVTQLVTNSMQQANEVLAQLEKAKEAIDQAKAQHEHYKKIMEGNNKLGDFLNDPLLNEIIPLNDLGKIYTDIKDLPGLRDKYGLKSDNPELQAKFDKLLAQAGVLEDSYSNSMKRVENAEALRQRINTVTTPQQREELQLRYQQEYLELQNQQIKMQNIQMLMAQKEKLENKKRAQDFYDYLKGNKS